MTDVHLGAASLHLLETALDSYEKLEIVRAARDLGEVDPESLLERLRIDATELARMIDALVAERIVRRTGTTIALGDRGNDADVVELMTMYTQDQVLVITTLSSLVVGRLRNMAATAFADAFVLRKRKGSDDG